MEVALAVVLAITAIALPLVSDAEASQAAKHHMLHQAHTAPPHFEAGAFFADQTLNGN